MRLLRPLVVALGGLALVAATTTAATAANGTFAWVGPKGKAYAIQNPPDHKCYDMGQEARGAQNATRQPLIVYTQKKCKGSATRLAPGQSAPSGSHFASVIFNQR
ncbi:hypothetical protein [Streptomyces orinoci]|uniref:Uncharacterized protein n=1 Tax=Streptomyces orinoci TaxID=67339 RepID=A0ABV3K6K6_STRON|nr:hypothetical protein [Streptomyces orinoci]